MDKLVIQTAEEYGWYVFPGLVGYCLLERVVGRYPDIRAWDNEPDKICWRETQDDMEDVTPEEAISRIRALGKV